MLGPAPAPYLNLLIDFIFHCDTNQAISTVFLDILLQTQAEGVPHDLDSIRAANHFAYFFVEQARRMNDHKFANGRVEEEEHLIYNWYTNWSYDHRPQKYVREGCFGSVHAM